VTAVNLRDRNRLNAAKCTCRID